MGRLGRVVDPFHIAHLAGDALDECRKRIQQELHHRRRRTEGPDRAHNAGKDTQTPSRDILAYLDHPTPQAPAPKPSTAASNTYADPHSCSETSPTTSPAHSSKQEDSDPNYTPNYEEPKNTPLATYGDALLAGCWWEALHRLATR